MPPWKSEYTLALNTDTIFTVYKYRDRAFDAMFGYYYNFVVNRTNELGLSKFLPLTGLGTFDPYKWNLENIVK
jgi:hypothetical protein